MGKVRVLSAVIVLVLVFGCTSCATLGPSNSAQISPNTTIEQAYTWADSCVPETPLKRLRPSITELRFHVVLDSTWGRDKRTVGQDFGRDIYVAYWLKDDVWIWAHEIVHAFGIKEHPDLFRACGLRYEDNR